MARSLQRRRYPRPAPVTVRTDKDATVVPAEAFPPRRSLRIVASPPLKGSTINPVSMEFDQRLFAAKTGDAFKVSREGHGDLWWFVKTVNGPEKTITAQTVIFGQVSEQIFPFDLCNPVEAGSREQEIEANEARERLGMEPRGWDKGLEPSAIVAQSLPARYRDLIAPLPAVCHGYAHGCNCLRCGYPAMAIAA